MTAASAALQTQLAALLGRPCCARCAGVGRVPTGRTARETAVCPVCCGKPAQLPRKAKRVCARAVAS